MLNAADVAYTYRSGGGVAPTDLTLTQGITGLVGANGAGKTTLMNMVSGALRPQRGVVSLDGEDLYGPRRSRLLPSVSLMPQSFSPVPLLDVEEFVHLFAWMRGVGDDEIDEHVGRALESADLADRRRSSVRSLSGGMMRRLLLAQALVSDPDVLVLDEPTAGLDPLHRSDLRDLVRGLRNRIVLVSSHLLEDVAAISDRVLVMHEGRVVMDEARTELPPRPEDLEREIVRRTRLAMDDSR